MLIGFKVYENEGRRNSEKKENPKESL